MTDAATPEPNVVPRAEPPGDLRQRLAASLQRCPRTTAQPYHVRATLNDAETELVIAALLAHQDTTLPPKDLKSTFTQGE